MITHENIEIIHYFLLVDKAPFKVMLAQLLAEYKAIHTPVRIVIFDAPVDNEEYVARFACIREAVKELFKEKQPSVSYVAQPPQSMGLVMEVHEVQLTEQDHIEYRMLGDLPYITIEREGCKRLFLSGVTGDVLHQSIREQSHEVFSRIARVLETEGMPVSSIIRQWNYIEKITACDATGHQHYQDFNDARSLFYNGVEWTTGYPAATGIGTQWGGIMIDVDALLCKDGSVHHMVIRADNGLDVIAVLDPFLVEDEDAVGDAVGEFGLLCVKIIESADAFAFRVVRDHVADVDILARSHDNSAAVAGVQGAAPEVCSGVLNGGHGCCYDRSENLVAGLDVGRDRGLILVQRMIVVQKRGGAYNAVGEVALVKIKLLERAEHAV